MSVLQEILQHIWYFLQHGAETPGAFWVYPLITVMTAVEGPATILLSSSLASSGFLKPVGVFAAASIGNLSADLTWYSLGYFSKIDWVFRRVRGLRPYRPHLAELQTELRQHGPKMLFIAKVTNGLIVPMLIAAGMARVPVRRWFPFVAIGEAIVTGLLVSLTFFAAHHLLRVEKGLEYLGIAAAITFLLVMVFQVQRILRRVTTPPEIAEEEEQLHHRHHK